MPRACRQFARLRRKSLIFENRSAAYVEVCEQRIAKNQRVAASIVELATGPSQASHYYIGFDFGMKRMGVAVGQTLTKTASPLMVLDCVDGVPDWHVISDLIAKWRPSGFVVGIPVTEMGENTTVTLEAKRFARKLFHRFKLPVYTADERFSTKLAQEKALLKPNKRHRNKHIDDLAAQIMLSAWLSNNEG